MILLYNYNMDKMRMINERAKIIEARAEAALKRSDISEYVKSLRLIAGIAKEITDIIEGYK